MVRPMAVSIFRFGFRFSAWPRCAVWAAFVAASVAASVASQGPARGQTFHSIDPVATTSTATSNVTGISADGSVVVGYNVDNASNVTQALRWTKAGGTQLLDPVPGLGVFSSAYGASANGSTVVGLSSSMTQAQGFIWTTTAGTSGIGFGAGESGNLANATSDDGSVVVGLTAGSSFGAQAYRWTQTGGKVRLGLLPGYDSTNATTVSGDGATIAGTAINEDSFVRRAFRWTAGGGLTALDVPSGYRSTNARGISRDGSTIVGGAYGDLGKAQAYRWTAAGGSQLLGFLPNNNASQANGASADGSVIVGESMGLTGTIYARKPFRWTQANGMQSIESLLQAAGVNLAGFRLLTATAVSADGSYIAGLGNQSGAIKGWVAYLPLIPPATTIVASILPTARTTTFGTPVTAFATIINAGSVTARSCGIELPPLSNPQGITTGFKYQTTSASTNVPNGTANTPVDIAPGNFQSFYFAVTINSNSTDYLSSIQNLPLVFTCANAAPARTVYGVTSFVTTASQTLIPDMLSIASVPTQDGILALPGPTGAAAMATAAINIGGPGQITCSASPNPYGFTNRTLPATISLCQTNAQGQCTNPQTPGTSTSLTVAANDLVTFSIFVQGTGTPITFDPANTRVFFACKQGTTSLGEASVAVRTP